jgi:hypothetical protein
MPLPMPCRVRAERDIRRFRTTVVRKGSLGTVVHVVVRLNSARYTVEFGLERIAGATLTVSDLSDEDIRATDFANVGMVARSALVAH